VAEVAAGGLAREVEHARPVAEHELDALGVDDLDVAELGRRDVLVQVVASIPVLQDRRLGKVDACAHSGLLSAT
jgi:hypothetical protein